MASDNSTINPSFSSPILKNSQSSLHFDAEYYKVEESHLRMADEVSREWVGPMPVLEFLEDFFPIQEAWHDRPSFRNNSLYGIFSRCTRESQMYEALIKSLKKFNVLEDLKLLDTSSPKADGDPNSKKSKNITPDITSYFKSNAPPPNKKLMDYDSCLLFGELKTERGDPFTINKGNFESTTVDGKKCRGEIISYFTQCCSRQFRTFMYAVWIGGRKARIIRVDRSGGIVSNRFDLYTQSHFLLDFFWRFSQSSPAQIGIDTTVVRASVEQERLAKMKLAKWEPKLNRPVYVVRIPGDERDREVLAWGALAEPESLTGRATKGFPAWDLKLKKVIFLKDSWRSVEPGMEQEAVILKILNQKKVRNVPKFLYGGDIEGPGHHTVTFQYASKPWNRGASVDNISPRNHNRFTVDLVANKLQTFTCPNHFLKVVYDAAIAHQDAYEKCGILHRDISGGNIMIDEAGSGVLNDWDLSKSLDDIKKGPRQKHRSGTWQFMSIEMLGNKRKMSELQDDLESFFYVVLYYCLRYMHHTAMVDLRTYFNAIFNQSVGKSYGEATGGQIKLAMITKKQYIRDFVVTNNPPLTNWIKCMQNALCQWHMIMMSQMGPTSSSQFFDNHKEILALFKQCLEMETWPADECSAVDNLPDTQWVKETSKRHAESQDPEIDEDSDSGNPSRSRKRRKGLDGSYLARSRPSKNIAIPTRWLRPRAAK